MIFELRKKGMIYSEIADRVNEVFNNNRNKSKITSLCYRHNKTKSINTFTIEELEFIEKYTKEYTVKETTKLLNETFGSNRTFNSVSSAMCRYNIKAGSDGRFKKGSVPFNHRPLYSERIDVKDGYILIKVAEPNVWKLKHRWIYENHHKIKLTSDDVIIFKDGDKTNIHIDNLLRISRTENLKMNKDDLRSIHPEVTEVGVKLAKLLVKIDEKRIE